MSHIKAKRERQAAIAPYKRFSENTLTKLYNALDIEDIKLILPDVVFKNKKTCCLFHDEKTPSASLDPKKNIYKCFGCGWAGNLIKVIKQYLNKSFPETVELLAEFYKVPIEYDENFDPEKYQAEKDIEQEQINILEFAHNKYVNLLHSPAGSIALEYLINERGLTIEQIKDWKLGMAPDNWRFLTPGLVSSGKLAVAVAAGICLTKDGKNFDVYRNGIVIPIHQKNGKLAGFALRSLPGNDKAPKYINPKDSDVYHKDKILFGLSQAITARAFTKTKFIYLTEGYFDVITCHEAGLLNVIASCGTAITDGQIKEIAKFTKHVVLFLDGDAAGIKAGIKHIDAFLTNGFKVEIIELGAGEDPDSYVQAYQKGKNELPIQDDLQELHQDAVLWKGKKLYKNAASPDDQVIAIDQIINTLLSISNEVKQNAYVESLQKDLKIKNSILKKELKKAIELRDRKAKSLQEKSMIEGKSLRNEDAGLPDDYPGDIRPFLKYGVYEYKGVYYAKGKQGIYAVSNFVMKILFHIDSSQDLAYKIISVTNEYGFNIVLQINTDDYITLGGFKKALARKGNFVFKGNDSDLSKLQEYLQESQVDSRLIDTLGFSKRYSFYAFANALIPLSNDKEPEILKPDSLGIVDCNGKSFFLRAMSKMYEDKDEMFLSEKKFIYIEPANTILFNQWAECFSQAYGEKSIAAILFFIASLFRDLMVSVHKCFPILNMYGQRGSGKGKMIDSLMRMFGESQDQIMLGGESTGKGFMRKFAQLSNAIVWLDEYKNSLPPKLIENLKNIFDVVGYTTAKMSNDMQTNVTPIRSSCILSGQEMPTAEPALFTRVIMLQFEPGKFTEKQRTAFQKLKKLEEGGLSYLTCQILPHRKIFEGRYQDNYEIIFKDFIKEVNNNDVDDRLIMNISMLAAVYVTLQDVIDFPFKYQDVKAYLLNNMNNQFTLLQGSDDLGKFWQVFENLCNTGLATEGIHYMIYDGILIFRMKLVHPLYVKHLVSLKDQHILTKDTLENYIRSDKNIFIGRLRKQFSDLYAYGFAVKFEKLQIEISQTGLVVSGNGSLLDANNQVQQSDRPAEELPFG
ncbi:hypothetical protein BH11BAC5_BH11BAC5_48680 [soil metagenome]